MYTLHFLRQGLFLSPQSGKLDAVDTRIACDVAGAAASHA